jgi:hypothetical protein
MIASGRNSVCMSLLRSKNKVRTNWLRQPPSKKTSPIWKAIENAKKYLQPGTCYAVGDGKSISIWKDPWVPWLEDFKPKPKDQAALSYPMMVDSLINPITNSWKIDLLQLLFEPESIEAICKITVPMRPTADKLIWVKDTIGRFSVKSVYQANQESSLNPNMGGLWQRLWKSKLHERSKIFLWRIGTKALPTKEMLANKMEIQDKMCYLCGHEE